jgi:hypothetical protein
VYYVVYEIFFLNYGGVASRLNDQTTAMLSAHRYVRKGYGRWRRLGFESGEELHDRQSRIRVKVEGNMH